MIEQFTRKTKSTYCPLINQYLVLIILLFEFFFIQNFLKIKLGRYISSPFDTFPSTPQTLRLIDHSLVQLHCLFQWYPTLGNRKVNYAVPTVNSISRAFAA